MCESHSRNVSGCDVEMIRPRGFCIGRPEDNSGCLACSLYLNFTRRTFLQCLDDNVAKTRKLLIRDEFMVTTIQESVNHQEAKIILSTHTQERMQCHPNKHRSTISGDQLPQDGGSEIVASRSFIHHHHQTMPWYMEVERTLCNDAYKKGNVNNHPNVVVRMPRRQWPSKPRVSWTAASRPKMVWQPAPLSTRPSDITGRCDVFLICETLP